MQNLVNASTAKISSEGVGHRSLRFVLLEISASRILREVEAPAETKSLVATNGWLWDFNAEFAETQRAAEYFWRHAADYGLKFIRNLNRSTIEVGVLKPFRCLVVRATSVRSVRLGLHLNLTLEDPSGG